MQVMIRCDAGATIGGGHLVRCSALGVALRRAGAEVAFAVSNETILNIPGLPADFPGVLGGMTGGEGDFDRIAARWPRGVELAVVDHYGLGEAFERHLAGWAKKVLVIDDAPSRRHICTHLVDTTFRRHAAEYGDQIEAGTVLLCGSDYAMLREPFRTERPAALANRPIAVSRILISMGLSDNPNATEAALKGLVAIEGLHRVDCVLGPAAPHIEAVRALIATQDGGWHLHAGADAETMAALTAAADLVIGAPGSASYERCCLGRPALLVITADNQRSNAAVLQAAKATVVVGDLSWETADRIGHAVRMLAAAPARLGAMHRAAASICDGNGADRVARAVLTS